MRSLIWVLAIAAALSRQVFNQSASYKIDVDFSTWSNFGAQGGCMTCPFTCQVPDRGPNGVWINVSNSTQAQILPEIYTKPQLNGCCVAPNAKSKDQPSCDRPATPESAEDCGFLSGPSLSWTISPIEGQLPPEDPVRAMLFASVDCLNFWAIGKTEVKQPVSTGDTISGSKVINGGCYGNSQGAAIVLAGCLSTTLKFNKRKTYSWRELAVKCTGLSGHCSRTNGLFSENLECCIGPPGNPQAIEGSIWNVNYKEYTKDVEPNPFTPGVWFGIAFGAAIVIMLTIHSITKCHQRRKQLRLEREEEYMELLPEEDIERTNTHTLEWMGSEELYINQHQEEVLYEGDLRS